MIQRQHATYFAAIALLVIGLFSLTPHISQAQQTSDSACPALVELALSQLGDNCADLGRNSACYGFNRVESTFNQTVSQGFFTKPADRAELVSMKTIQSAPLDLQLQQWGIAVLNVQANVPDTLPGQAVTFLLMGDTQVENAVDASQAAKSITVITQKATDLRSGAEPNSTVLTTLPAGVVMQADALSSDGTSIRVSTDSATGWIDVASVNPTPQLAELAATNENAPSPMQAFYFRTGPGQTTCNQTPSVLAVQSPEGIKVDLTANGANIRLGSLITLQVLPDGKTMKLTTLQGDALLNPDTPDEVHVPAGFTTTRCLSAPQSLGLDGEANDQKVGPDCPWEPPGPTPPDDLDQGQIVQAALERLDLARQNVTPTPEVTETPEVTDCPVGTTIVHVVATGENLYRIGLRYNTSVGAIMQANNITNPEVVIVGQSLKIPCGLQVDIPSLPNVPPTQTGVVVTGGVNCAPFRATSPLDGFSYGSNTFYWDAAPGANGYRVNVYSVDQSPGALVDSFTSTGSATNLSADLTINSIGYGFYFAWEVQALLNGQVVCTSARFNVPRAPEPPAITGGFNVGWQCVTFSVFSLQFSYSKLPAGTTSVTITYSSSGPGAPPAPGSGFTVPVPPDPGSAIVGSPMSFTVSNARITANPSGRTVGLPGSITC